MTITLTDAWTSATEILVNPSPKEIVRLLTLLLEDEGSQEKLDYIKNRLDGMVRAHLGSGRDYMRLAEREANPASRDHYLRQAMQFFVQAANSTLQPEQGKAMEYVALCLKALGNDEASEEWLRKAYTSINGFRQELRTKIKKYEGDLYVFRHIGLLALAGVSMLGMPLYNKHLKAVIENQAAMLLSLFEAEKQASHLVHVLGLAAPVDLFFPEKVRSVKVTRDSRDNSVGKFYCYDEAGRWECQIYLLQIKIKRPWGRDYP